MTIRLAVQEDLDSINAIYNQSIITKSTADTIPVTMQDRLEWFRQHSPLEFPVFVFETNGLVIGWLSLSPYRKGRMALRRTAEISYYIHNDYRQQGVGGSLVNYAINMAGHFGFSILVAIILEHNTASIKLMEKCSFEQCGFLPEVADFDGKLSGHFYFFYRIN